MKTQFSLRFDKRSKKTNLIPVIVTVYHKGFRVRKTLFNIKVQESDWLVKEQRIKVSKKNENYNNAKEYNFILENIKSSINQYWGTCFVSNIEPKKDEITRILNGKKVETNEQTLTKAYEDYIEQSKSHRAKRTIIGYTTTLNLLIDFVETLGYDPALNEIDLRFFDTFRNYCFEERKFLNNYFAKIINNIKAFMVWAEDRGLHTNSTYRKFKASEESIEVIYLTKEELLKFYSFEFESSKLAKVRDIYCFSCFTGLRYSDLKNLKPSQIKDGFLKLNIEKTRGKDQIIPLTKYANSILEKYSDTIYAPLPMISSQKLNKYIKEAAKEAGIDEMVTITRYSGRVKKEQSVPKSELLTIHTARKTFVTVSLVLGMNQMTIRSITGHKSDSAFRKYVNVADGVKQDELIKHWKL